MSSCKNKILLNSCYNKNYLLDNQIRLKTKKESKQIINIKNFNKINRNINKNNSSSIISENITPKIVEKTKQKGKKDEEKLIIKTRLIKLNNDNTDKKSTNNHHDKYHINFELLLNSGINDEININMTFV